LENFKEILGEKTDQNAVEGKLSWCLGVEEKGEFPF
jgi:hypothetical protein